MDMKHEIRGSALILKPSRRIDSSTAKAFEDQAASLIDGGPKKVVIDFSELDYISSAGLRVVLTAAKKVKALGGGLTLCGLQGNIKEVIDVSGFATILGAHGDVDAAIAALG